MDYINIFSIMLLIVVSFSLYVMIKTKLSYSIKFLLIPLLLALSIITIIFSQNSSGTAHNGYPIDKFSLIAFRTFSDGDNKFIELWIKENSNKNSRLYRVPFTNKLNSELQRVMDAMRNGKYKISMKIRKIKNPIVMMIKIIW